MGACAELRLLPTVKAPLSMSNLWGGWPTTHARSPLRPAGGQMSDDRTHYTGDSCPGGHMDLKACPTCGSGLREQRLSIPARDREHSNLYGRELCPDPWHSEPQIAVDPAALGEKA